MKKGVCIAYGNGETRKTKPETKEKQKRKTEKENIIQTENVGVNYPEHSGQQSRQQQAAVREIEFERSGDRVAITEVGSVGPRPWPRSQKY